MTSGLRLISFKLFYYSFFDPNYPAIECSLLGALSRSYQFGQLSQPFLGLK